MADLNWALRRIGSGARVQWLQDAYGRDAIKIRRSWFPWRTVIQLRREDTDSVRKALAARRQIKTVSSTIKAE